MLKKVLSGLEGDKQAGVCRVSKKAQSDQVTNHSAEEKVWGQENAE